MSQSRFSIVLVGVSALLRRPLVSRLRPAEGERSSWVVFAARGGRFDSGFRSVVGLRVHCFRFSACTDSGCPRRVGLRAHCFRFSACADSEWPLGEFVLPPSASGCPRRVGLRAHCFRFSARTVSELPFGELAFGLTASAFRHAPLRSGCWASSFFRLPLRSCGSAGWPSDSLLPLFGLRRFGVAAGRVGSSAFRFGDCPRRVGLRVHRFRFSACTASEWLLGELVLLPSVSAFATRRVGLRAHGFRFSARTASGLPSASWFFCLPFRRLPLGGLAFGFTASAFRHAPLRGCCSAGWPSGSRLPLFGMRRSAPPHRRREGRRSAPTRQLFHFKTLIPTC